MSTAANSRTRGADLLREWRTRRRLDKAAAAKAFGVSRQTYTKWESREKTPDMARWFLMDRQTRGAVPWTSWTTDESLVHIIRRVVAPKQRRKRAADASVTQADQSVGSEPKQEVSAS